MHKRLFHWYRLFRRAVWPLFAVPFAILANLFSVRDEFLSPELAAKLKMPEWLPAFPWYYWTILVLVLIAIALLEGAYREHIELTGKISEAKDPARVREIEALERHTEELSRNTASNDPIQRVYREKFANQFFGHNERRLEISVGDTGSFVHVNAKWIHDLQKMFNLKVENRDSHKPLSNCKLIVQTITPDPGYRSPWILKEGFSLAGGDHTFVPLASYGEAREPSKTPCADTLMTLLTRDRMLALGIDTEQLLEIRATSPDSAYCDIKCKLWVDDHGRFRIAKV
jgi:hypothetical protein